MFNCAPLDVEEFNLDYRDNLARGCQTSGYPGINTDTDLIGNLHEVSLTTACERFRQRVASGTEGTITMHQLLADVILVIHALFVGFVVFGLLFTVIGAVKQWRWIRAPWFRVAHLIAIGIVVLQAWLGSPCPLTIWENSARRAAGGIAYTSSFIQHWLHQIIFYDFAPWVFTLTYTLFGMLVILTWILAPPIWRSR